MNINEKYNLLIPSEYVNLDCFNIPDKFFIYSPLRPVSFSDQGEEMVLALIGVAPSFHITFNKIVPLEIQGKIAKETFEKLSAEWKASRSAPSQQLITSVENTNEEKLPNKKQGKKYFETNRKFSYLVPPFYKRTAAPRISAKGSTFHGMKKILLLSILERLAKNLDVTFMEVDMSAAHSRIALYLLSKDNTDLGKSLDDPSFWKSQISLVRHHFKDSGIDDNTIKKILKVGLYTSLNGGNPRRDDRIVYTLALNAEDYNDKNNISTISQLKSSQLFSETKNALKDFNLIDEVQSLNKKCAVRKNSNSLSPQYHTYTVDKVDPYIGDSVHLGISRVLQGFEVVLLSTLVKDVIQKGVLPISLDHDGLLVMISNQHFKDQFNNDPKVFGESFKDSSVAKWSLWMLKSAIPIEVKHLVNQEGISKF